MSIYDPRKSKEGLTIEFIGSPGSGKSSLVPELLSFLNSIDSSGGMHAMTVKGAITPFTCRTLPGKIAGSLPDPLGTRLLRRVFMMRSAAARRSFIDHHPALFDTVWNTQLERPPEAAVRERHILKSFRQLAGYYALLSHEMRPGDVLVFDEGFVHKTVQLFASDIEDPNPFQVTDYLDLVPQPDLVIFVRAPLQVCMERIRERGLWRHFQKKSEGQLERFMANALHVIHLAIHHMHGKGWNVIEVDNDQEDLSPAAEQMRHKVGEWLVHRRRHGSSRLELAQPAQRA